MKIFNITNGIKLPDTNRNNPYKYSMYLTCPNMMSYDCISFGVGKKKQKADTFTQQVERIYNKSKLTNDDQIEAVQLYQQLYSDILFLNDKQEKTPIEFETLSDLKEKEKMVSEVLIKSLEKFISHSIRHSGIPKDFWEDVKQNISLDLLNEVFLKFDINKAKGCKFISYTGTCVNATILEAKAQIQGMETRGTELSLINKLNMARDEYKMIHGVYPSDEELTKILQEKTNNPKLRVDTVAKRLSRKLPSSAISLSTEINKHGSNKTLADVIPAKETPEVQNNDLINKRFCNIVIKIAKSFNGGGKRNTEIFMRYYKEGKTYQEIAQEQNITKQRVDEIIKNVKSRVLFVITEEVKKHPDLINNDKNFIKSIPYYLQNAPEKLKKLISHFENMSEKEIKAIKKLPNKKLAIELIKDTHLSNDEIALEAEYSTFMIKMLRRSLAKNKE